jgi:class 3 adenylate cyclase
MQERYPVLTGVHLPSLAFLPAYRRVGTNLQFAADAHVPRRANFTAPVLGVEEDGNMLPLEDEPLELVMPNPGTLDGFRASDFDLQGSVADVAYGMMHFLLGVDKKQPKLKQVILVARTLRELRIARRCVETASVAAYGDLRVRVGSYALVQEAADDETRYALYKLLDVGDARRAASWRAVAGGLTALAFPSSNAATLAAAFPDGLFDDGTSGAPTASTTALVFVGQRLRWVQAILDVLTSRPGSAPYTLAAIGGNEGFVADLTRRANVYLSAGLPAINRLRAVIGNIPFYIASPIPLNALPLIDVPLMSPQSARGFWAQSVFMATLAGVGLNTDGASQVGAYYTQQKMSVWYSSAGPNSAEPCASNVSAAMIARRVAAEKLADDVLDAWNVAASGGSASPAQRHRFYEQLMPLHERVAGSSGCLCRKMYQTVVIGDAVKWAYEDAAASWNVASVPLPECGVRYRDPDPPVPKEVPLAAIVAAVVASLGIAVGAVFWWFAIGQHWMQQRRAPKDPLVPFAYAITDIQASTTLWARMPQFMAEALEHHNRLLRQAIDEASGYEVKTVGDCFMVAFTSATAAVQFAARAQELLHTFDWGPSGHHVDDTYRELFALERDAAATLVTSADCSGDDQGNSATSSHHQHDGCVPGTRYGDAWNCLRVRIGVHYGYGTMQLDPVSNRYDYAGPVVQGAHVMEEIAHGGQICVSAAVRDRLRAEGTESSSEAANAGSNGDCAAEPGAARGYTTITVQSGPESEATRTGGHAGSSGNAVGADGMQKGRALHVASEHNLLSTGVPPVVGKLPVTWWHLGDVPVSQEVANAMDLDGDACDPATTPGDDAALDPVVHEKDKPSTNNSTSAAVLALQVLPRALAGRLFQPLRVNRVALVADSAAGADKIFTALLDAAAPLGADDLDLAQLSERAACARWFRKADTPSIHSHSLSTRPRHDTATSASDTPHARSAANVLTGGMMGLPVTSGENALAPATAPVLFSPSDDPLRTDPMGAISGSTTLAASGLDSAQPPLTSWSSHRSPQLGPTPLGPTAGGVMQREGTRMGSLALSGSVLDHPRAAGPAVPKPEVLAALERVRRDALYARRVLRALARYDRVHARDTRRFISASAELAAFWYSALQPIRRAARGELLQSLEATWRIDALQTAAADAVAAAAAAHRGTISAMPDGTGAMHDAATVAVPPSRNGARHSPESPSRVAAAPTQTGVSNHQHDKATATARSGASSLRSGFARDPAATLRGEKLTAAAYTTHLRVVLRATRAFSAQTQLGRGGTDDRKAPVRQNPH